MTNSERSEPHHQICRCIEPPRVPGALARQPLAAQDLPEKRSRRLAVVIVRCLPTRSSGEKQRRRGVVAVVDCDVKRRPPALAVSCAQQRCTGGHRGAGRWRENQCGGRERTACGVTMQRCCSVAHVAEVRGGCGFDSVASGALRQRTSRCAVARQPEDCSTSGVLETPFGFLEFKLLFLTFDQLVVSF